MPLPRIAICGLHIESSTFTPYVSTIADFEVTRGQALLARYSWMDSPWASAVQWIPILHARALPGGVVEAAAYEGWKAEILDGLASTSDLDAIFFDIHGAMSVQGHDDVEGDLITAIRAVVGPEPLVSASMDLHGNVSNALFDGCDLLTCYRMAPHEDAWESRERAARNLVERVVSGTGKPAKALIHVPILLPGEKTSTRVEPAKGLYGMIPGIEARPGILDAAIWVGFAWADQPRCTAAVVVTGDDAHDVTVQARLLASEFWRVRNEFSFVSPVGSMAECLDHGLACARPYLISDSGDNPGAGGADDVTVALAALLDWTPVRESTLKVIHASIYDPSAAAACWEAGVGGTVSVELGGHIDTRAPGPQPVTGVVTATCDDPRGGITGVIKVGGLQVIVTSRRNQYTELRQFERVALDPRDADVVVVKIGYLEPDLYDAQADWMMALTPGGVDQDLVRLNHHRITRPMFPFDPDMADPTFHVRTFKP